MRVKTPMGTITASRDVLNRIAIMAAQSESYHYEHGHSALASYYCDISDSIYDTLNSVGYYDSVKYDNIKEI